jgi:hypothetical protein
MSFPQKIAKENLPLAFAIPGKDGYSASQLDGW